MKKTILLKSMLLLCALIVGSSYGWADPLISWSRSNSTDSYTSGYTFTKVSSPGSGATYYQDGSTGSTAGLKLYHTSTALFSKTPSSITFTASIGGGSGNRDLGNYVRVCFVDKTGTVISDTEVNVTNHITNGSGDTYNISMPTAKATQAYGIFVYHTKESGYNVRYYSFSLSAVIPSKNLIGSFDAISDIEIAVGDNQAFDASDYFTPHVSATEDAKLTVTPGEGDGTYAYFKNGTLYATAYGTEEFTITATPAAADAENFDAASKTFNVKVLKVPNLSGITDESIAYGNTLEVSAASAGALTLTSGNTSVATVSGTVLTGVAVGTSTITVNSAKNSEYVAGSKTFTLTVTSPTGGTTKPATDPETVFEETFDESTGGPLSDWGGSEANGTFTADKAGWTVVSASGAGSCAKFGANKTKGSAETPNITVENGKAYTLTFKAAPWSTETTKMDVSVTGGTITGVSTSDMNTKEWNDYTATVSATSTTLKITFEANNNRFFLDEVNLIKPGVPTPSATIASSGYGSFCCQYPLNLPADDPNFKAYIVTEVTGSTVTFSQISGKIQGGVPFILFGTPDDYDLTFADESTTVPAGNMLQGTLAPTYITTKVGLYTNFGLSGGQFVKINDGTIPAGKAYLPILTSKVPTSAHALDIVFEDGNATGITNIERRKFNAETYYNLAGQRVDANHKGIVVVNGKKFFNK